MQDLGSVLLSKAEVEKWEARRQAASESGKVAGLFRGWKPAGFDDASARILYVGKATSGSFHEKNVESTAFNGKGSFWDFARQIASALACSDALSCIAWSNISKISRPQIAADAALLAPFEDQAIETLEAEILATNPDVVVFVTGHFNDKVVRAIAEGADDSVWTKSEEVTSNPQIDDVWWRTRNDGIAVLWMRHPQGASSQLREYATSTILSLT